MLGWKHIYHVLHSLLLPFPDPLQKGSFWIWSFIIAKLNFCTEQKILNSFYVICSSPRQWFKEYPVFLYKITHCIALWNCTKNTLYTLSIHYLSSIYLFLLCVHWYALIETINVNQINLFGWKKIVSGMVHICNFDMQVFLNSC